VRQVPVTLDLSDLGYATEEQVTQHAVNVKDFGAVGDGVTDDTDAIQAAIDSLTDESGPGGGLGGGTVLVPVGVYKVSSPLTVGAVGDYVSGLRLKGASIYSTIIQPTDAFGSASVVKFINARHCAVEDLGIHGDADTPPRSMIQFHRDTPGSGAPAITANKVTRVALGKFIEGDSGEYMVDGIRVTCAVGQDGNNDFNVFKDFNICGFTGIGISYEGKESVCNKIVGGQISVGPVAVSQQGGSLTAIGLSTGEIHDCEFDFLDPFTATYTQATTLIGVDSEADLSDAGSFIRTTDTNYVDINVTGYTRYGSEADLDVIDFNSHHAKFSMSDSRLQLGQADQRANFTSDTSYVQFTGVSHGLDGINYAGDLIIVGGHEYTTCTKTPDGAATLTQIGGVNDSWAAFTPTLSGTGWAIGDGTITGRYKVIGKTVFWRIAVVFGGTSTFGASDSPEFSLPVDMQAATQGVVDVFATDAGTASYALGGRYEGVDTVVAYVAGVNGLIDEVTATAPFTWVSTDRMELAGVYETDA
jgi:hypothetical protein